MVKNIFGLIGICAAALALFGCIGFGAAPANTEQEYAAIAGKTPKLDGKFDDAAWKGARWDHDYVLSGKPVANNDAANAHFNFAVCSDAQYIYVAIEIFDDALMYGEHKGNDAWMDDSIEICLDALNEKSTAYDPNDATLRIGATAIGKPAAEWGDVQKGNLIDFSGTGCWAGLKAKAVAAETAKGWNVEAAIPVENDSFSIEMKDGLVIGFNLIYNDSDSGSGRDRMIGWSKKKGWTDSSKNASVFGTVKFSGQVTASKKQSDSGSTATAKKQEPAETKTVQGRVLEYDSRSKKVIIKLGSSTPGIKPGLVGKIYNDATKTKENGVIELTRVYPMQSEGVVRNQVIEFNLKTNEVVAVFEVEDQ
jgi:hypothetical protein